MQAKHALQSTSTDPMVMSRILHTHSGGSRHRGVSLHVDVDALEAFWMHLMFHVPGSDLVFPRSVLALAVGVNVSMNHLSIKQREDEDEVETEDEPPLLDWSTER